MKVFLAILAFAVYTGQSLASTILKNNVQDVQTRQSPLCGDPANAVTLLRAARSNTATAHYYSTNATTLESWITQVGGYSEGDAARVFETQQPSTTAVHLLNNHSDKDNVYTTSDDEVSTLEAEGWTYHGIAWYAYTSQICESVPFYVVNNPTTTDHIYTTNITERDTLINGQGYVDEGIAMYVLPFTG